MIRPLLFLIGAAVAGSPGCARMEAALSPSAAASPPTAARSGPASGAAPRPPQAARDRAAQAESCRRDADRIVLFRDRGQLMREDERDARVGTGSSVYASRIETDRLGRAFERDRIAAECLNHEARPPPPRR